MLDPAPTTKIADNLARATVLEFSDASATKPAYAVLGFSNTDYQLFLEPMCESCDLKGKVSKKVIGSIHMDARKVSVSSAGGQFIDPCAGLARRVQGTVVAVDTESNQIVVNAGIALHLTLTAPGQHARNFASGDFVGCDVLTGARFQMQNCD
jgi:hypothetical protein